ncbi:serine protease [Linnemannia hyalina]|uniref:Serine protease n=1 Tax=Linnemannia hyalina TaxID=64524 RepID=A0A9P7Y2Z4_9FUNG|nr:serine protease [Linnemannia hyalina]
MAPLLSLAVESKAFPDYYLVVFKDGVRANDFSTLAAQNFPSSGFSSSRQFTFGGWPISVWNDIVSGVKHAYDIGTFQGIPGRFHPGALHLIRANLAVAYVECDSVGRLTNLKTQHNATWGPARLCQRSSLAVKQKDAGEPAFDYVHELRSGLNVTVFVIDTGINLDHKEFEGRAKWRIMTVEGGTSVMTMDMAPIVRALWAVAPLVLRNLHLVAVKVIGENGHGSVSEFIRRHLELKRVQGASHRGSVAILSIGYERSRAMDTLVRAAIDARVHVAVAAGNTEPTIELKGLVLSKATRGALINVPDDTVNLLASNGEEEDNKHFHTW